MSGRSFLHGECAVWIALFSLIVLPLCGCSHGPVNIDAPAALSEQKVFDLKEITPDRGRALLSELGLGTACVLPGRNAVSVSGSASDLYRAGVVLEFAELG
jgi:hypothetical protein